MKLLENRRIIYYKESKIDFSLWNNIVICGDKNVVASIGVTICSIIRYATATYAFHIFFKGILTDDTIKKIKNISSQYNVPIIIYSIDDRQLENLYSTEAISIPAYYRLLAPYILNEYETYACLYVDTDILCTQNIDNIFSLSLQNYIAYVVKDPTSKPKERNKHCTKIGMKTNKYFNSGVMLINIPLYVKNDIGNKAIQLAAKKDYPYMDQDVLNILLEGNVLFDEQPLYNCTMSVTDDVYQQLGENNIKIVHFTGDKKPWKLFTSQWGTINPKDNTHSWKFKYYKLWRQCAAESPWAGVPYDMPKNAHEWRWLSDMYRKNGEFIKAVKSYYRYVTAKLST